ncbi:MAG: HAMP domain-containing histidine kinase [Deltaproteobacteria bacterium]|nr:HAMP domain-containing histidine kinase [Deltaproteobacteria bacterium]
MRTLSARILLGFATLTLTFAAITATLVYNTKQIEDQFTLIGKGYMQLALASKDLARRQDDLRNYLDERLLDESNAQVAALALRNSRANRDRALATLRKILDTVETLVEVKPDQFIYTKPKIAALEAGVAAVQPLYAQLTTSLPTGKPEQWDIAQKKAFETLQKLRSEERKLMQKTNGLSEQLDKNVSDTTHTLEQNEKTLRLRTIYLGLAAVLLGLLITIWVVITLRPLSRLREAARRIASGDYASRIPERGPAEVADLAREFNSMGRAVEEREREVVRAERLAAVGKMAAMITHEVRNPLSSIGLNTELLEDELAPDADEARALCRAITHEVDRLTAITEEYLAFARLPKPKLAQEPINAMVTALAAFVREDLAARQVVLTTELCTEDLIGTCDAGQIRQCLINLVRNAADAVAVKGKGWVVLRTRRDGDRAVIEVEDSGVGIPSEVLPRLFDPFFSTKDGGNGLGLALTQQIVRDHGGDVEVSSTVGRGTTFTVRVPAA